MPAMTVTVTGTSGAPFVAALDVTVLTGAAPVQNGVTAVNSALTGTPDLAITPGSTGSYVFGAEGSYPSASSTYTATAATTFTSDNFDITNTFCTYGTFYSTAKTTAATPVTLGATAPGSITNGSIALAEIKASGTLAIDASTPAGFAGATSSVMTSPSFTPPTGGLLVVTAWGSDGSSGQVTLAITDSYGLTWTRLALASGAAQGTASIWTAFWYPLVVISPPPAPQMFLPPGAQAGAERFTPWLPWEDARPPVPRNATVTFSAFSSQGGAVPGAITPGALTPGAAPGGGPVALTASASFPVPAVTATASPVILPPSNCAWVRSSYY